MKMEHLSRLSEVTLDILEASLRDIIDDIQTLRHGSELNNLAEFVNDFKVAVNYYNQALSYKALGVNDSKLYKELDYVFVKFLYSNEHYFEAFLKKSKGKRERIDLRYDSGIFDYQDSKGGMK